MRQLSKTSSVKPRVQAHVQQQCGENKDCIDEEWKTISHRRQQALQHGDTSIYPRRIRSANSKH